MIEIVNFTNLQNQCITKLNNENKNLIWDWYNNLLLSGDINRVRKLLVRYELFKKIFKSSW